jgi:hypothetical protein
VLSCVSVKQDDVAYILLGTDVPLLWVALPREPVSTHRGKSDDQFVNFCRICSRPASQTRGSRIDSMYATSELERR